MYATPATQSVPTVEEDGHKPEPVRIAATVKT